VSIKLSPVVWASAGEASSAIAATHPIHLRFPVTRIVLPDDANLSATIAGAFICTRNLTLTVGEGNEKISKSITKLPETRTESGK
jgi:hypothetical protein